MNSNEGRIRAVPTNMITGFLGGWKNISNFYTYSSTNLPMSAGLCWSMNSARLRFRCCKGQQ